MRRGPVGLVAASGTGAQRVSCLLDMAGVGVSHVLGVGGRDLSEAVGGLATFDAMAALDADPATERVLLVSKPRRRPWPRGSRRRPTRWRRRSAAPRSRRPPDLPAAVEALLQDMGHDVPTWPSRPGTGERPARTRVLKGLYSGGTLADEAMLIAAPARSATSVQHPAASGARPGRRPLRHRSRGRRLR